VPFTDLEYRDHDDGHRAVLLTPLIYHSGVTPDSPWAVRATVPAGYCTDFASVPRWLWPICPPRGRWNRAAIIHDYLYERRVDRFVADALFRSAMKELGVPMWRRLAMYYAVRLFGGLTESWRRGKGKL